MKLRPGDQISDSERSKGLACAIDKGFQGLHDYFLNFPPRILPIGCLAAGVALVCSCSGIGGPDTDGGADAVKSRKRDKQVIALGEAEGFKACLLYTSDAADE